MANEKVRKLAKAAQISDFDEITWLEEQVSRPRIFIPIKISPIDEFKELVKEKPREATDIYWKEIDQRNFYFRTSIYRMIREHTNAFLNSFECPLTSAAPLRGVIECTVKFVGINWAIVTMYDQIECHVSSGGPKGALVMSQQLEDVLLLFSHFTKAEIEPLLILLKDNLTLEEALSKVAKKGERKQPVPTISKLFGIAKFLEPQMGSMLHDIYNIICDLIHSGPLALALKDADDIEKIKNIDINDVDSFRMHGFLPEILMLTYPILGYKALLICFQYLDKYLFTSPSSFWETIQPIISTDTDVVVEISFNWVDQFLRRDDSIILQTTDGKEIRVYK